jgi:hypothetical protein
MHCSEDRELRRKFESVSEEVTKSVRYSDGPCSICVVFLALKMSVTERRGRVVNTRIWGVPGSNLGPGFGYPG